MTHHLDHDAPESWAMCRKSFAHRAVHIPELSLIPRLIDWIVDQGLDTSLYANSSLDNLVISDAGDWRTQSQKILVIPKKSTVEVRFYSQGDLVQESEFAPGQLYEELDRLLPKLLRDGAFD